jgi:hypothetical protein
MKKTSNKIFGSILVVMIIATIGAVVVSAHPEFLDDLTDEQKTELKDLKETLIGEGASRFEIKENIREQLESYGYELPSREEMLDKQIEHTELKLDILKRTKELIQDNPEITPEEIKEIIQEEFELELPEDCFGKMHKYKCHRGPKYGARHMINSNNDEIEI